MINNDFADDCLTATIHLCSCSGCPWAIHN